MGDEQITAADLDGLPELRTSARAEILARQPKTVVEALAIRDVGRKVTAHLLALGRITDPDGKQRTTPPTTSGKHAAYSMPAHEHKRPSPRRNATKSPNVDNYRDDPLYPRIVRAVAPLLVHGKVVAPVDVLVGMGILEARHLEDWRFGRVPYLEKVIQRQLEPPVPPTSHLEVPRPRLEPGPVLDGIHALGQGAETTVALHQDR